jgi:hypothetical protein
MSDLARIVAAVFVVVTAVLLLIGCATTSKLGTTRSQHIVRLKTCLQEVAHVDPGPLNDTVSDGRLEAALHAYYAEFGRTDVMGMGRDPKSAEVRDAANKALLYGCWQQGKLPADDPLAAYPYQPPQ